MKVDTKILLTIMSVADIIWGSGGFFTVVLWVGYGMYKEKVSK